MQFMAKDSTGTLYTSLGGSDVTGTQDIFSGPYASTHDYSGASGYDNIWSICQEEIDLYAAWWEACNGPNSTSEDCLNAEVPSNDLLSRIYAWPAHGDYTNGEDYWLAPYYDHPESTPGTYDPSGGDYPLIKGCCASYLVQNDDAGTHTYSGTYPIGIQVHYMFYQYKNWGLLNDVTFVDVIIQNRSGRDYPEFVYGAEISSMIGDTTDDYLGTDSTLGLYYMYNNDNDDNLFGINPPAFGMMAVEPKPTSIVFKDFGAVTNDQVWNQHHGLTANGQPFVDPQNNPSKFVLHSDPNSSGGWSEEQSGPETTARHGIMSFEYGPFPDGAEITQTYAFVYHKSGNRLENVSGLLSDAVEIEQFYDTIANAKCEDGVLHLSENMPSSEILLYPNPAAEIMTLDLGEFVSPTVSFVDITGKIVQTVSGSGTIELNVSSWANGIYLLYLESEQGSIVQRFEVLH